MPLPHRYELGEKLGAGGMGVIYQARDTLAAREVAYKQLRVSSERDRPRLTALFQREYDTLARLSHPNIVAAYDYGFDEEGPYYAMELLPGRDLAKLAPLHWRETCRVLRDIASALSLIHARRLIHRDVSPNNVRISHSGHAKLLDFGALTAFGRPTEIVGTPAFIAPECLTAEPLDQRADLFALGALAYWTLTARSAVRAHSLEDLAEAHQRPIAPPSHHVSSVPPELDELVLSLLQTDKNARPRSAADVIERLTTIGSLEPEAAEDRVALGYLEHTPLEGRAAALTAVRSSLSSAVQGRGSVVLIDGSPGMGRTALLEQVAVEAQLRGATALRAEGRVHTSPLSLLTHLVGNGLAAYPGLVKRVSERLLTQAPTGSRTRSPLEAAQQHADYIAAMQDVLLQVAERGPLVILVDDAEFADAASMGLLASMSEIVARHPILLVITRLSGPTTTDSMSALAANATLVSLPALSEDEIGRVARSIFGDVANVQVVAHFLHDASGGAPASCVDIARALLQQGEIKYTRGSFILPSELVLKLGHETARGSVLRSLEDLDGNARQLANLLCLAERALRVDQLVAASGRTAPEVFRDLTELSQRRVIIESGANYTLANQAVRTAVAEALEPEDLRVQHLALARAGALEIAPALLDRYASGLHYMRAGEQYELQGAQVVVTAARERSFDVAQAADSVRYLEAALEVYRRRGYPDQELVDLLVPLSVAGFYGDLGAQRRHLEPTMHALYALSGLRLAIRLRSLLGARLALIISIVLAMIWHRVRPARLHRRSVLQVIEAILNVASTATASAASIMEPAYAQRIVAWLAPFEATPANSAMQIARQFCLAVADLPAGRLLSAQQRLACIVPVLENPVPRMEERVREQMRSGCLNALAQVHSESDPALALQEAAQLSLRGAFFAPHAELIRALHVGFRGDLTGYERHRARTESAALRGGVSWSAMVLLTLREHQISVVTGNTNALVRAGAELRRLATLGEWIATQAELARADLLLLRGNIADATAVYAAIFDDQEIQHPFALTSASMYARALREGGRPEHAKALCERLVGTFEREQASSHGYRLVMQELALAEAELGLFAQARERLEQQLALALGADDNPLVLGTLQRDRARLAIVQRNTGLFEESFVEMKRWFQSTQNPWLLQQTDAVLSSAVRAGIRPAVLREELSSIDASSDEMDGSTLVGEEHD